MIKNCPFCGYENVRLERFSFETRIQCPICGALITASTEDEVLSKWNARVLKLSSNYKTENIRPFTKADLDKAFREENRISVAIQAIITTLYKAIEESEV